MLQNAWARRLTLGSVLGALLVVLAATSCADDGSGGSGGSVPWVTTGGAGGGGATGGSGGLGAGGSGGSGGPPADLRCPADIEFISTDAISNVRVAGEWQNFDLPTAVPMTGPTGAGVYSVTLQLAPGLQAYKIVYDDPNSVTQWVLNPNEGRRKYVGGVENSAVKVRDCSKPTLHVESSDATRPAAGQGHYAAALSYVDAIDASGPDPAGYTATLDDDVGSTPLASPAVTVAANGGVTLDVGSLSDGKYRVVLRPRSLSGHLGDPVRLVFWIEAERFSWQDALIYMVVTDRFVDGDAGNNPGPTQGADPRGDWYGGDLEGIRQAIAAGTLDQLGVRALWLTPFQTNPTAAYLASDGVHMVAGYHGYWPVKAREVEPRIGGEAALHALVREAHAHGIRILQDFVLNHVHEDHEYVAAHPDWFRTGCVCGTANCDWTAHALDCMFASYLPDVNHTVPEANAQFVADAVWWLDQFDLDGLRVDAVKHVEEVATRNLAAEVRETFEPGGTRYFLMGETAMGWNDCADPCNDENYGTIAKYIGPLGLDGQFDFVLYHGVSYRTFAYSDKGMLHADYWLQHGLGKWPAGAIMTPYIGSHDTARFATLADYRGQDAAHDRGVPGNQWSNTAVAPSDAEPYRRTRIAMSWLLGLPGAPLLYYGDEYGEWGGADPNNRHMWRAPGTLAPDETTTLTLVRKLGSARRNLAALRRGDYVSLSVDDDTLVFGRHIPAGAAALVGLTRLGVAAVKTFEVQASLGWLTGTVLHDDLGGPNCTVGPGGQLTVTIPAGGSVVLHP